jgi:hypothetical protein
MATTFATLIGQVRTHLQELPALSTPSAPTITPQGTTGASTWTYKIEALNRHQTSIASAGGSTTTGNATLSSTNYNRITWTAVSGASAYRIYRTAVATSPTTTGMIAIVSASALQFDDTGVAGDASTAPTVTTGGSFWTDAELLVHLIDGAKDMWAACLDTFGDHFFTDDITNVSLAASATQLTGVPADTFRVLLIEPRDTTVTGTYRDVVFVPRKYNHPDFIAARAAGTLDPATARVIFYDVTSAGTPVGTPVVLTAPKINAALTLRFVYCPVLGTLTSASNNPIPGEADKALVAYATAFARAKERDDRSPDPNWLAVYATEKQSVLVRITPRQEQEAEYVQGWLDDQYYQ